MPRNNEVYGSFYVEYLEFGIMTQFARYRTISRVTYVKVNVGHARYRPVARELRHYSKWLPSWNFHQN